MTYKINKIFINDKKKDGTPYIDKRGKPYKMAGIYFEGQTKSASMFCYPDSEVLGWKIGDEVEVILSENNGYLNAKLPSKTDEINEEVNELKEIIGKMRIWATEIEKRVKALEFLADSDVEEIKKEIPLETKIQEAPWSKFNRKFYDDEIKIEDLPQ